MTQSTIPQQTLERIKVKVDEWRAGKKAVRESMPEALWKEIAGIAPYFSLKTLTDSFKIDLRQIKKHNLTVGTELQRKDTVTASSPSKAAKPKPTKPNSVQAKHAPESKPEKPADKKPANKKPTKATKSKAQTKASPTKAEETAVRIVKPTSKATEGEYEVELTPIEGGQMKVKLPWERLIAFVGHLLNPKKG